MARPLKTGIDYFPLDVDIFDDEKVIPISSEFGAKGECIVVRVLCAIYREGYFAECSPAFKFKIAKQANVPHTLVDEVISGLVKWGFFDKSVFDSFGILTSKGIQKRWKEATRNRVKKEDLEFWLIDEKKEKNELSDELDGFLTSETQLIQTETTQKKRKESKVNSNSNELLPCEAAQPHAEKIDYDSLVSFFNSETKGVFGNIKTPLSDKRKKMISARVKEHGKKQFAEVILKAAASPFLKGQNNRSWTATLDWIIKPTNFEKILSGNYDNRSKENTGDNDIELARNVLEGIARANFEKQRRQS